LKEIETGILPPDSMMPPGMLIGQEVERSYSPLSSLHQQRPGMWSYKKLWGHSGDSSGWSWNNTESLRCSTSRRVPFQISI